MLITHIISTSLLTYHLHMDNFIIDLNIRKRIDGEWCLYLSQWNIAKREFTNRIDMIINDELAYRILKQADKSFWIHYDKEVITDNSDIYLIIASDLYSRLEEKFEVNETIEA